MADFEIILRAWRDGSIHAEMHCVTIPQFPRDHSREGFLTHLVSSDRFSETACGVRWFGMLSSSGWQHPHSVDCADCRAMIADTKATIGKGH